MSDVVPASLASIAPHLVLPAWWVRAYEETTFSDGPEESAMRRAAQAGLAPVMSSVELNALAVVLASLQEQMLAGQHRLLVIRSEDHLKHASTTVKSRLFAFERIVQQLAGVRILAPGVDKVRRSYKIFAADSFISGEGDSTAVELLPTRLGAELTLGLADPHLDLVRLAAGEPEAHTVLGGKAPLGLWRSVWLELGGLEQSLFLRVERAMQWETRWLTLDGVFGLPLDELFRGLRLPETRDAGSTAELVRRLRVLDRLGRRLASHGFLAPAAADQYLAVDAKEETEIVLAWQAGRERLASEAMCAYRVRVAEFFVRHRFADFGDAFHRLFLGPSPTHDALATARADWGRLTALPVDPEAATAVGFSPCQPLAMAALFHEWRLRRSFAQPFPLPDLVVHGRLSELTAPGGSESVVAERFAAFARYFAEHPQLGASLQNVAFASYASTASKASRELRERLSAALTPPSPEVRLSGDAPKAAARELPSPQSATQASAGGASVGVAARPVVEGSVSGALASRMRRIASDELAKMRASAPERYGELRRAYFSSIDVDQRRTILDCQKTMPVTMFEEHLKHRLVRYMVENPGGWRTTAHTSI